MIKNYLAIAIRYFSKSVIYSIINLAGLITGITASVLLMLYVWDELRHDQFHKRAENIVRVTTQQNGQVGVVTPGPLGVEILNDFPEIEQMARVGKWSGTFRYKDVVHEESQINFADHALLEIFDFPLLSGDPKTVLLQANEILLTEMAAEKYFGAQWQSRSDVIGAVLTLNGADDFIVAGVLANLPSHSSIQFDFLISFQHIVKNDRWGYQWGSHNYHTYLLLSPQANVQTFERKIKGELKAHQPDAGFDLGLQPLRQIYLNPIQGYDWGKHGQKQYVLMFSIVAGLILVIACFNYINLSTARARKRAREVGVRKIIGANKRQLFFQFMGESTLIVFGAALVSRALIDVLLPQFNGISGKNLSTADFQEELAIFLLIVATVTSILAGVYPALLLSSFKPLNVLKGSVPAHTGRTFRSVLVTTQFAVSMILITSTLIIYEQLSFMQAKEIGFNKSGLLYIRMGGELRDHSQAFKDELLKMSFIQSAAISTSTLVNTDNSSYVEWPGKAQDQELSISQVNTDHDFIPMMGIQMVTGRNFNERDSGAYILNEQAVKAMGLTPEKALGLLVKFWGTEGTVIGIAKDFHFRPLHHVIGPLIMRHATKESFFTLLVRIDNNAMAEFQRDVEKIYKKYEADYPFQYGYVDEMMEMQYQRERSVGKIILYFSFLSVFICVLGLFGLVSYSVEVRTKEFSIRKVLGSSQMHIFSLLSKQFLWVLVVAFLIAVPSAWFISTYWLQNFSYQVPIKPSMFFITLLSVGTGSASMIFIQAWMASRKNPAIVLSAID